MDLELEKIHLSQMNVNSQETKLHMTQSISYLAYTYLIFYGY